MKKMILYLMLISCGLFSQFSFASNADDGDDGEEIIIEYSNPDERINRGIISVPIDAVYYSQEAYVGIQFLDSIGNVEIVLTNLSTGASSNSIVNSMIGNCIVPVNGGSGVYSIEFFILGGVSYNGHFLVLE